MVIAGGVKNMSMVPMAQPKARWGHRMEVTGKGDILELMVCDGLYEIIYRYHKKYDRRKHCGLIWYQSLGTR